MKTYTLEQFLRDVVALGTLPFAAMRSEGLLSNCCSCGATIEGEDGKTFATAFNEHEGIVVAVCAKCVPDFTAEKFSSLIATSSPHLVEQKSYFYAPASTADRVAGIKGLEELAVARITTKVAFPFIGRILEAEGLNADERNSVCRVYTAHKNGWQSVRSVMPWRDDDPQFVYGRVAREALAMSKSIRAGKSEVTFLRGSAILTSCDEKLLRELAA